ncbi:MAG: hypothetical protein MJZ01_00345 [Bacteroidales bacterium]|nr:hypothetical protein [Bacteroidales bacterium]
MGGISFFKLPKHRVFEYRPLYYDPEKEQREQRRRELGLADDDNNDDGKYKAGQFIRSGAMRARHDQFAQKMEAQKRRSQFILIALIIGLSVVAYYMMRDYWDEFVHVIFK